MKKVNILQLIASICLLIGNSENTFNIAKKINKKEIINPFIKL